MIPIIDGIIALATEIMKLVNTNTARKYLDRMVELKNNLQTEEAKGYYADDAKIESWLMELKTVMEAIQLEVVAYAKK